MHCTRWNHFYVSLLYARVCDSFFCSHAYSNEIRSNEKRSRRDMRHKLRRSKTKGRIFVFLIITVLSHWNSISVIFMYQSLPIILAALSTYSFGGLPILYRNKWNVNSDGNVRKYVLFYLRTNYNFSLCNLLSSRSVNEVADFFVIESLLPFLRSFQFF